MKAKKYFIIRAKVRSSRKPMYFTGNSVTNGLPLFSTDKRYALPFLKEETARNVRLVDVPVISYIEEIDSLDWIPKKTKNSEAN